MERRRAVYGPTRLLEEMKAHTEAQQERWPKWEPEQRAVIKSTKEGRREIFYLVCTDGTTYMWIPRLKPWGQPSWQLIRITKRHHDTR